MFQIEKKQQLALLVIIGIIIFGAGFKYAQHRAMELPASPVLEKQDEQLEYESKEIVVHVKGAVNAPGVYHFSEGARVIDAVQKAEALDDADVNAINLAAPLVDGNPVMIPFKQSEELKKEINSSITVSSSNPAAGNYLNTVSVNQSDGMVNINTADIAALDSLPGIGETLAGRVIQYRQTNGPFKTIEDLKNVSGIGEKKFNDLKDMITLY